jgi:hypothetical protein
VDVGEDGEQVGRAAEHGEGGELQQEPLERGEVGAGSEVDELERDGEVGGGDEEVAHPLALQHRLHRTIFPAVARAAAVVPLHHPRRRRREVSCHCFTLFCRAELSYQPKAVCMRAMIRSEDPKRAERKR